VKQVLRGLLGGFALLLALAVAGATYESCAEAQDGSRFPAPGVRVDVGGRRLHLLCRGQGAPTVLLEASGLGNVLQYEKVQARLSQTNRVCAYDRAGMGWSDRSPGPADARALADDLGKLLRAAPVAGPYVLVAASAGGLPIELYAREHPEDAVGLVGVDALWGEAVAAIPEIGRLSRAACVADLAARLGLLRLLDPFGVKGLPRHAGELPVALTYRVSACAEACGVTRSFDASAQEILAAPPLRKDLPAIALVHGEPRDIDPMASPAELAAIEPRWREAQARFVQPMHGRILIVEGAGHLIAAEQPEVVVQAVRNVIELSRAVGTP
jgi:pimeloyl-ACP methyl ester carboxylesterase